jgi:hypothetical protein
MAHPGMVIETTILIRALRSQPTGPGMTFFRHTVTRTKCYVAYSTVYELYVGATTPAKVQAMDDILAGLEILVGTQASARTCSCPTPTSPTSLACLRQAIA